MKQPGENGAWPPRYWWLKRVSVVLGVIVVGVVGLRICWGWVMSSRLEATVQAIRAKGEPLETADLETQPIGNGGGEAVRQYQQVLAQWPRVDGRLVTDPPPATSNPFSMQPPPDLVADNDAYLALCRPAFELLRRAADAENSSRTVVFGATRIASLVEDAVERLLAGGRAGEAARLAYLLFPLADHMEGFRQLGTSVRSTASRLFVEACGQADLSGVVGVLARRVIADLLDDRNRRRAYVEQIRAERVLLLDNYRQFQSGAVPARILVHDFTDGSPTWYDNVVWVAMAPLTDNYLQKGLEIRGHAADAIVSGTDWWSIRRSMQHPFSAANPSFNAWVFGAPPDDHSLWSELRFRLQATAIAVLLYEQDHGSLPHNLQDLTPDYLDVVPEDPFADLPGQPLLYALSVTEDRPGTTAGRSPAVVYSRGRDGHDDGGRVQVEANSQAPFSVWNTQDVGLEIREKVQPLVPASEKRQANDGRPLAEQP